MSKKLRRNDEGEPTIRIQATHDLSYKDAATDLAAYLHWSNLTSAVPEFPLTRMGLLSALRWVRWAEGARPLDDRNMFDSEEDAQRYDNLAKRWIDKCLPELVPTVGSTHLD